MINMISPTFLNFDAAGNNLPPANTENNFTEKDFATFFDQMFVYPTNLPASPQNSGSFQILQTEAETTPLAPVCIRTVGANPLETISETIQTSPPLQNQLPTVGMPQTTNPVKMPPRLPEQTTNPVNTPPIFEQTETVKVEMNTQKDVVKVTPPVETPPIIIPLSNGNVPSKNVPLRVNTTRIEQNIEEMPSPNVNSDVKTVKLNSNTKRVEQNVEETPPIIVLPENGNSTTKKDLLNSNVKIQNPSATQKSENNIAKNEANTAKIENNTAKAEYNTAKAEYNTAKKENNISKNQTMPPLSMNTDKGNGEKDWNTSRDPKTNAQAAEIDMVQQVLNLSKMNGKAVRREFRANVNTTITNGSEKDYTPILIPNETVSAEFAVKTENSSGASEKPSKLENILFNLIAPKSAETSEISEQKSFGNISLEEFQIKDAPKSSKMANFENELTANAKSFDSAELAVETNPELFTKSVFPKRKDLASAYEAANFIRGEETNGVKFEIPQEVKTPNSVEKSQISEQVEAKMNELAAKIEQTKETQILKMRLHPAELGTVEIHLEKNAHGHLQAHLSTETETARTALHENIDQLRNTLEKAGWQVSAVEVSSSTTSTTHYNGNQQNANSEQNNYYQSFSRNETANELSQNETNDKDNLSHIVSLRA